jgi:hypothetical protein
MPFMLPIQDGQKLLAQNGFNAPLLVQQQR